MKMNYTYICATTGEEKEVSHGMNDKPEILSSEGRKMSKKIEVPKISGFDSLGRSRKEEESPLFNEMMQAEE